MIRRGFLFGSVLMVTSVALLPLGFAETTTEVALSSITSLSGTVISSDVGSMTPSITIKDGSGKTTDVYIDRLTTSVSGLGVDNFEQLKAGQDVQISVKYQNGLARFLAKSITVTKLPEIPQAPAQATPAAPAAAKPASRVLKSGPKSESAARAAAPATPPKNP